MKTSGTLRRYFGLIILASLVTAAPACLAQPATTAPAPSTAGTRSTDEVFADFKQTLGKLRDTMGEVQELADPAKREKVKPLAVPILKRLIDDLDELVRVQPTAKT